MIRLKLSAFLRALRTLTASRESVFQRSSAEAQRPLDSVNHAVAQHLAEWVPSKSQAKRDRAMPLTTCPECHSAMEVKVRGEVLIDVCPSCRGVWLDGGELEKILIETRRHESERLQDERLAEGHPVPAAVPAPTREPLADAGRGKKDKDGKKGKDKGKKKKKRGLFDLADLVEDLFD